MAGATTFRSKRDQLELFRALPRDLAPRDAQDLMAYPFFSLSKSHRVTPIDFRMGEVAIRVEATHLHLKSGSLSPLKRFAFELRDITRRQPLPDFRLAMEVSPFGRQLLTFKSIESDPAARVLRPRDLSTSPGDKSGDKL